MERNPEFYGQVTMLYVDIKVNGVNLQAFVDSGAQSTIISKNCADKCNLTSLIDTRYKGEANGIGTANIIGRIHLADIEIEGVKLPCAFTVMENDIQVDMLFGPDNLRRH